jgi:hypothetical protein
VIAAVLLLQLAVANGVTGVSGVAVFCFRIYPLLLLHAWHISAIVASVNMPTHPLLWQRISKLFAETDAH